jgi:hypothetical protein
MKKTKVVGALALTSCVLLSGCNLFKKKILEVSELPHLVAGEEFDLQSYVTAQGYKGSFSVALSDESKEFVKVDESGTKITAEHSGDIKFAVNYGKKSVDCEAVVDSKEYVEYAKVATDKQHDFELDIFGYDSSTQKSYVDYVELYTDDYFLTVDYPESESGETSYVGLTEIGNKVISFSLAVDAEAGTIEVDDYFLQGDEPESLSSKCKVFPLVASKGKCKYVPAEGEYEAYESIVFTDEALVSEAAEYLFGFDEMIVSYYDMKLKEIEVVPEEVTYEGETWTEYGVVVSGDMTINGTKYEDEPIDYLYATLGDDAVWFEGLEDEFVESLPANGSATEADLNTLASVLMGQNYTLMIHGSWYDMNLSTYETTPYGGNPFLEADKRNAAGLGGTSSIGNYIVDYLNAEDYVFAFVTESQTLTYHQVAGAGADVAGLVEHNEGVWGYAPNETFDGYEASLVAPVPEISDESLAGVAQSYQHLMDFGDVYYNTRKEGSGYVELDFAYGAAKDQLYHLFVSSVPEIIHYKQYSSSMTPLQYVHQMDDISNLVWFLEDDLLTCDAHLVYTASSVQLGFTYEPEVVVKISDVNHYFYYSVEAYIMDIGTTDIEASSTAYLGGSLAFPIEYQS